jgi:adenine-specific DNA-methyltransferase
MDEIFGMANFRNWITRKKCHPKGYTKNTYGNIQDFILFYSKSRNYVWNRPLEELTEEKIKSSEYRYIEEETGRVYKKVPLHAPGVRNGTTGQPWRGLMPPKGKHWQYSPEKLEDFDRHGRIYWSPTRNPRLKVYLDERKGVLTQDIWLDFLDTMNQFTSLTEYPTEKNQEMIERIIKTSSNEGDIILDCFAGSGTTLAAAEKLDRRWIGIDNSKIAIETTKKRLSGFYTKQKVLSTIKPYIIFHAVQEL